jgi:hypothetical protein
MLFAGLWVWSTAATCPAQEPSATEEKPARKPASDKEPGDKDAAKEAAGQRLQLRIDKITKLQTMTEERVEMSSSQKTAVRRLFSDYLDDVRASFTHRGRPTARENKVMPPSMAQLQSQLDAAKNAADKDKVAEIEQQMSNLRREPTSNADDFSDVLIEKVKKELKPSQVAEFDKVVERWKAISPRGPRSGPFQQLRRALSDPDVGLTEAQKATTDKILEETLRENRSGGTRDPQKMAAAVEKAKGQIFQELTAEQRAKVEADLKMFRAEDKNFTVIRKNRPKAGNPADTPKTEQEKDEPEQPDEE